MTDLINRMEGGQIINEWGQFFKKTGKEALEKIGKESIESILKTAKAGWGEAQEKILNLVLKTQGGNTEAIKSLANYVSRASQKPISHRNVLGLLEKAFENPTAFKANIDEFMTLVPRELIDKSTNKIVDFRKSYKKYLGDIADAASENALQSGLKKQGVKSMTKGVAFKNYGKALNRQQMGEITAEATGRIGQIGKQIDNTGFTIKDLTLDSVQKVGNKGGRDIYEVTFPNGESLMFWQSSGGGRKAVKFSPKNSHLDAPTSKGYFGVVSGQLDTSGFKWIKQPDGSLVPGPEEWFIKSDGWERGYGSESIEDAGIWLKSVVDSGAI